MKILFASLIVFTSVAHSESWIEVSGDYECPDLLIISDSKYEIFNDCYGFDPKKPIVDSGDYLEKDGRIFFSNRKIEQTSFLDEGSSNVFELIIKNNKHMSIRSGSTTHSFKVYSASK